MAINFNDIIGGAAAGFEGYLAGVELARKHRMDAMKEQGLADELGYLRQARPVMLEQLGANVDLTKKQGKYTDVTTEAANQEIFERKTTWPARQEMVQNMGRMYQSQADIGAINAQVTKDTSQSKTDAINAANALAVNANKALMELGIPELQARSMSAALGNEILKADFFTNNWDKISDNLTKQLVAEGFAADAQIAKSQIDNMLYNTMDDNGLPLILSAAIMSLKGTILQREIAMEYARKMAELGVSQAEANIANINANTESVTTQTNTRKWLLQLAKDAKTIHSATLPDLMTLVNNARREADGYRILAAEYRKQKADALKENPGANVSDYDTKIQNLTQLAEAAQARASEINKAAGARYGFSAQEAAAIKPDPKIVRAVNAAVKGFNKLPPWAQQKIYENIEYNHQMGMSLTSNNIKTNVRDAMRDLGLHSDAIKQVDTSIKPKPGKVGWLSTYDLYKSMGYPTY